MLERHGATGLVVRPEEVVPGQLREAAGRGLVAEGAMRSSVVVVLEPDAQRGGALRAVAVDGAVGPAGEQGTDEWTSPGLVDTGLLGGLGR
jgi:hypothetical protein